MKWVSWLFVIAWYAMVTLGVARAEPWGRDDAPVTIMVFSSFTCPYCATANKQLDQLRRKYPNDVRIVFRHFPLSDTAEARRPHLVAAAAQAQGKFWEAHDIIFGRTAARTDIELIGSMTVGASSIDGGLLRAALADGTAARQLQDDAAVSQALKVRATPTFFIDGLRLEGVQEMATFESIIDFKRGATAARSTVPSTK